MDGQWSFKRLLKNAQRTLSELGKARAAATSTGQQAAADGAIEDVRADLAELADDLEERADYITNYYGRDPVPWADHVARREATEQRAEVLGLLSATAEQPKPAPAPAKQAARPAAPVQAAQLRQAPTRPSVDPREAEIKRLEAQIAANQRAAFEQQAIAKVQALIRDARAMPAERKSLIAMYTWALVDDARDPAGQRVANLDAMYAVRQQHSLMHELVRVGEGGVLESGASGKPSRERIDKLLSYTPEGQAVLQARRKKGNH